MLFLNEILRKAKRIIAHFVGNDICMEQMMDIEYLIVQVMIVVM